MHFWRLFGQNEKEQEIDVHRINMCTDRLGGHCKWICIASTHHDNNCSQSYVNTQLSTWQLAVLMRIIEEGEITKTAHEAVQAGIAFPAQEKHTRPSIDEGGITKTAHEAVQASTTTLAQKMCAKNGGRGLQMAWDAMHRGEASDVQKARIHKTDRGLKSVRISQNAPDSAERSLNSEFKELFEIAKSTFQDTNVLLKLDNRRYTLTDLLTATIIANWNIIIERTAAIQEQDPLGFAGVSQMMEQFRGTAKQWNAAANKTSRQRRDVEGPGIGQGKGGYQKELAKRQNVNNRNKMVNRKQIFCSSCGTSSRRRSKRERRRTQGREGERRKERERERREEYTACRRARTCCNSLQHNPILVSQVTKRCTDLDRSLFYILISGEFSSKRSRHSFLQKITRKKI